MKTADLPLLGLKVGDLFLDKAGRPVMIMDPERRWYRVTRGPCKATLEPRRWGGRPVVPGFGVAVRVETAEGWTWVPMAYRPEDLARPVSLDSLGRTWPR